jgi:DASS family divalent anion:Na+ symporter
MSHCSGSWARGIARACSRKSAADQVFLLQSGALRLAREQRTSLRENGLIGGEAALGASVYQATVSAEHTSVVYEIPAQLIDILAVRYKPIKALLFDSFALPTPAAHPSSAESPGATPATLLAAAVGDAPANERCSMQLFGWISTIVAPLLVLQIASSLGMHQDAAYFMAIISCTVAMWVFNLVPAFIPPLFSVLATILFDVAPAQLALAGFSSNGFFMLLSVFAIGALMVISGLTYRISLHILKIVPASPFWYNISIFLYGLILTPLIPSQLGRTTIILPFLSTLIETSGGRKNNPLVAHYVLSAMLGVGLAASIFLTGKPANLIVFGMFDTQTQFAFSWLQWLYAASFTGVLLVSLYLLIAVLFFGNHERSGNPRYLITSQLHTLGPMSMIEWSSLAGIALVVAGILTTPLHKVEIAWLSLTILVGLLLLGSLQKDDVSKRIDWTILIFISSVVAWVPIMKLTGIDTLVSSHFAWVGAYMKSQLPLFILFLCCAIVLIRFALPEIVTEILLVSLLLPLASQAGVSPWLIGFIILTMCEAYIFPYQAPYHIQLKNQLALHGQDALYDEKQVIRFNGLMTFVRILAIYASLPFWKYLDIL